MNTEDIQGQEILLKLNSKENYLVSRDADSLPLDNAFRIRKIFNEKKAYGR